MLCAGNHLLVSIVFTAFSAAIAGPDECGQTDAIPDPSSECCGYDLADDHRNIQGNAAINQFPWLALVEDEKGHVICTGTLISLEFVLTAAQCVLYEPKKVRLGEYNKTHSGPDCAQIKGNTVCNDGAVTIPIESTVRHPEHNKNRNHKEHDIAILKLAERVPYNEFIRPICLPTSDITKSPPDALRFINAGWGNSAKTQEENAEKHYVELPYVPLEQCREIYKSIAKSKTIGDNNICAGGEKDLDSCKGDGGGPLMSEQNAQYTLDGIVSSGISVCGTEGVPSLYTKVYPYLPWIQTIISS